MAELQILSSVCVLRVCLYPTEIKMSPYVLIESLAGALFKLSVT